MPAVTTRSLNLETKIVSQYTFDAQHQDMTAVENRNRQQVQDAQIQTHQRHQTDQIAKAALGRRAGRLHNAQRTLHLLQRDLAGE